eukprot:s573_g2.t1
MTGALVAVGGGVWCHWVPQAVANTARRSSTLALAGGDPPECPAQYAGRDVGLDDHASAVFGPGLVRMGLRDLLSNLLRSPAVAGKLLPSGGRAHKQVCFTVSQRMLCASQAPELRPKDAANLFWEVAGAV